ncbi:hypothetical protein [Rhizobium rhizophilum]|uniref:Uncharacterized protein n=1 Tax=Rhizobium rhizophilum TaxID=1850373 RepID=A0ABY2QQZ2_9HYPH|nr:hypothetical protein [Rhizobium rhizophilum]THV12434.1 hypothetical protein E9677_16805 [Rhizobium rhizophilum]
MLEEHKRAIFNVQAHVPRSADFLHGLRALKKLKTERPAQGSSRQGDCFARVRPDIYTAFADTIFLTAHFLPVDQALAATREIFRMPYYLVTHTSLIEGEDEVSAAQKVLAELRSARSVEFLVKFDEASARPVTIAYSASPAESPPPTAPRPNLEDVVETARHGTAAVDPLPNPDLTERRLSAKGIVIGAGLFAAGLFMGLAVDLLH